MPLASTSESSAKEPIKVTKTKTGRKRSSGRRSASLARAAHEPRDHPHGEVGDVKERGDAGLGRRGIARNHAASSGPA